VRSLVVRMRLEQALPTRTEQAGYDAEDLWIHSLAVSNAADCLAQRLPEVDRGLVSTLGLLHDIGKLAINSYFPNAAAQLHLAPADRPDESFLDRERRVLGADHAEIGALLAAHWKLPSDLVEAIRWHHAPLQAPQSLSESVRKATTLVHIANQISKYCYVYSEDMEIDIVAQEEFDQVGLPGPLPRLLNGRMRGAISRAIFFAEDSRTRTLGSIRRFVRLCDPAQAARIVELPHTRGRGEAVVREEDDADRYFGPEALSVDVASRRPGRVEQAWKGGSRVRFGGKATAVAMDALVAAVTAHQESLPLSEEARLPARFLARRLLPNLTEVAGGGEMVDVAQWLEAGRFTMAIRSDDLAFARRFATPMRSSAGRRVVEQELANVLNLRWFSEIRASSDGSTLVFVSHPNRR
jgi:putative nucleotidyltransferase with HDIG domain